MLKIPNSPFQKTFTLRAVQICARTPSRPGWAPMGQVNRVEKGSFNAAATVCLAPPSGAEK
ncbi:hypothetical protein TERTU_2090 [Teredinibacter turnerae T7901]|uniref:Uncharacterized protein n=1 Tax=Teredinibacter turnerae (strain ATCC 39867 / T7901) TaxID=377629 RepID=C5BIV2_TERTT|nr:hypothetical protein TERTU_2090 [Teredinibacter turnerae T7901]